MVWNFHYNTSFLLSQQNSVISSNTNLALYGQGLLQLTGDGDAIKGERLSLSLFYNVTVRNYLYKDFCSFFIFFEVVIRDLNDFLGLSLVQGTIMSKAD